MSNRNFTCHLQVISHGTIAYIQSIFVILVNLERLGIVLSIRTHSITTGKIPGFKG